MENFSEDLLAVSQIDAIPTILEVICRTTGLGFAAVARVTEDRWIACAVRDGIEFGLEPGGELQVETTICNEIRQTGRFVAIDHVSEDQLSAATRRLNSMASKATFPFPSCSATDVSSERCARLIGNRRV